MGGPGSGRRKGCAGHAVPYDKNPMSQARNMADVDPRANSKVVAFGKALMAFEPPDFSDAAQLEQRFYDYLDLCDCREVRPMVSSMANAFGISRQELQGIAAGHINWQGWRGGVLTREGYSILKKAYTFLETAWETYLMEDKGNPVKYIFLGKNYFGMRDQTEQVQVRVDATPTLPDPKEVAAKYAAMVGRPKPEALPEAEVVEVEDA